MLRPPRKANASNKRFISLQRSEVNTSPGAEDRRVI